MAYCTPEEVRAMIKDDALNSLIGDGFIEDPAEREAQLTPIVEAAIDDASAEIDGYLAKRYGVPLSPVPGVIGKFAKDMAVYNLFSRQVIDESSEAKNILNRYNAAVRFLTLVAKGDVDLGISDPATAASTGFSVKSSPRLFSRDSMRGM